jgi:hypothetical protein
MPPSILLCISQNDWKKVNTKVNAIFLLILYDFIGEMLMEIPVFTGTGTKQFDSVPFVNIIFVLSRSGPEPNSHCVSATAPQ